MRNDEVFFHLFCLDEKKKVGTCTSHPIFLRKPKRSVCLQKTRHLDYATYPRENVFTEQYHGDKTKLPSPFFQDTLS